MKGKKIGQGQGQSPITVQRLTENLNHAAEEKLTLYRQESRDSAPFCQPLTKQTSDATGILSSLMREILVRLEYVNIKMLNKNLSDSTLDKHYCWVAATPPIYLIS